MVSAVRNNLADEELLDGLSGLARALSDSSDLDDLEDRYLDAVRRVLPFKAVGLYVFSPHALTPRRIAARGVSDYFLARYEDLGRDHDPVLQEAVTKGVPALNRQMMDEGEWRSLPVWDRVFSLHQMTTLLEVPILDGAEVVGTLNFGDREDPPYGLEGCLALAQAVGPLVGLTVRQMLTCDEIDRRRKTLEAALDACDQAVVVSDLAGGDRHVNASARDVFARVDEEACPGWFEDLLAEARPIDAELRCAEGRVPLVEGGEARVTLRSLCEHEDGSVVVSFLLLEGSEQQPTALPRDVAQALTPREREVVGLVVAGLHDAEVARRLLLSPHTVKHYLKGVYRKLGLESRVALTRLVLTGGSRSDA